MGTFYRLADRYRLRGWDKLPHAIVDGFTGNVAFLSKPMMETLLRCDGSWDFDSQLTPDLYRQCAAAFLSKGRIEPCDEGSGMTPDQRYRFYGNRFMKRVHRSITGRCNYRCKHCFMQAPDACYGELSHASVMDIARQIVSCGVPAVSLTGGEPLLRPDFMDIASELDAVAFGYGWDEFTGDLVCVFYLMMASAK